MTLTRNELIDAYAAEGPLVRMNFVSSIDGAVTVRGRSGGLGSDTDRALVQVLRAMADVILVGAGTVRVEGYGGARVEDADAAWRQERGLPPQPRLAVVSRALDLEPQHPFFAEAVNRPLLVTCASAPADKREALAEVADLLVAGDLTVDLGEAIGALAEDGMAHVLCEGGPHLFGSLLEADLVDELCLTLSPHLVGGGAGRIVANVTEAARAMRLKHALVEGDWLFLRYSAGR